MSSRLNQAADFIDSLIAENIAADPQADQDMVAEARHISDVLRSTERTDLDKAVWPSVFTCLQLKGDVARILSCELLTSGIK